MKLKKILKNLFLLGLLLFVSLCYVACPEIDDYPYSGTFNAQLQQALDETRVSTGMRGVSAAVIKPDGTTWAGFSNKYTDPDNHPVDSDQLFGAGSVSKTFTAAVIFKQIEEGRITLDTQIGDILGNYLDEWGIEEGDIDRRIRIRQLLAHTSGIGEYLNKSFADICLNEPDTIITHRQVLGWVGNPYFDGIDSNGSVNYTNGNYEYTNTNYNLLAMIAEVVDGYDLNTGPHFAKVLRDRILRPKNVNNVYSRGLETISGTLASGYVKELGLYYIDSLFQGSGTAAYSGSVGCGGLSAAARDLAGWIMKLYGDKSIVGAANVELMKTRVTSGSEKESAGYPNWYGLATRIFDLGEDIDNCVVYGHSGSIVGFRTWAFYWPEKDVSVAVMVNEKPQLYLTEGGMESFDIFVELMKVVDHNL